MRIELSKEDILERSDSLFLHFLGSLPINVYIKSPLRSDDAVASFNLYTNNGITYYKDWGGTSGNIIDFVMNLYSLSFNQAMETIQQLNIKKRVIPKLRHRQKGRTIISYAPFSKYTLTDLNYWEARNVTLKELKQNNIVSAMFININGIPLYTASLNNPIYIYPITCKGSTFVKSYIPNAEKEIKFRNNYPDVRRFIHGLDTMDRDKDYIVITKSVKDELVLKGVGCNSISTQGEDIDIPLHIIRFLKSMYKRIYILYDCDYNKPEPYKFIDKQSKKHNLTPVYIPLKLKVTDIDELMVKSRGYAVNFIKTEIC